ncbi:MAG: hypothetical protein ACLRYB_11555 [Segatella copri]
MNGMFMRVVQQGEAFAVQSQKSENGQMMKCNIVLQKRWAASMRTSTLRQCWAIWLSVSMLRASWCSYAPLYYP